MGLFTEKEETMQATTETTAEKATRKGRKPANKVAYRAEGSPLLTEWPGDFDPTKHTPLSEEDFDENVQYLYWDNRAEVYRKRLQEAESEAALCRKYGSKENRAKVSQVAKLQAELERLKATLGEGFSL